MIILGVLAMTFDAPNYTQVPNSFIELCMREISPAELKTMMVVLRYTTGFHRRRAAIALSTYVKLTGLTKQGVVNSLKSLSIKGWIDIFPGNRTKKSEYEILIKNDTSQLSRPDDSRVVNSVDQGGQLSRPQVVNSVDHINKVKKNERKDIVLTMPLSAKDERRKSQPARFVNQLNPDQRKAHDQIIKFIPQWGPQLKSDDVCAWFLSKKYTTQQVIDAFMVYRQDAQEAQAKGRSIKNMGGAIVAAIKTGRQPKNAAFEANKQMAIAAANGVDGMQAMDQYVKFRVGNDEETLKYNLPSHSFSSNLEHYKRKTQMECV